MKNFDNWNIDKKNTQKQSNLLYFYEREIWYIKMGVNLGVEQDGKGKFFLRPVVILKKFNKYSFYGIPLTSVNKTKSKYHLQINGFEKNVSSFVGLSQIRLFDSKRLVEKKGMVNLSDYQKIKQKVKELFE